MWAETCVLWRGPMKYSEVFQIVPDSYSGAAESSPGVAIAYNGNLNTD